MFKTEINKKIGKEHSEDFTGREGNVFWLLDGATMPSKLSPVSTLEYTNALSEAIRLNANVGDPKEILRAAITEVSGMFERGNFNPSATAIIVSLENTIKYGVLGDSTLYIKTDTSEMLVSDNRLKNVAVKERKNYHEDRTKENHIILLKEENRLRNKEYFIAEYESSAADRMILGELPYKDYEILLMSDGMAVLMEYGWSASDIISEIKNGSAIETLRKVDKNDDASYIFISGQDG